MIEQLRHPGMRLGRLASRPEDRQRTLKLARYLPAPVFPAQANVGAGISSWPMYANDQYGDCTCAAAGHMEEVWTSQVDGTPRVYDNAVILALYNLVNGGRDDGANMLDVLSAWRHQGLGGDPILAYCEVDHRSHDMAKAAIWYFSGLYVGVNLPATAQAQTGPGGSVWDVVPGGAPNTAPGSWGGHAINAVGYDDAGVTVVTWGALQRMTWAFWDAYVDETYAVLPSDYDRLQGKALANGFNEDQLKQDLAQFGAVNGGG